MEMDGLENDGLIMLVINDDINCDYQIDNKIIWMKKTRKYLRFEQLGIELSTENPKDISRAVFTLRDQDGQLYKTSQYGQVTQTTINWGDQYIEILYNNQQVFNFETVCQHEYGYQLQELKALYNGQIYIKTQFFFRPLTVHVFNDEGTKCGILRYVITVVDKEIEKTASKAEEVMQKDQPQIKLNMIAKLTLYAASMTIVTPGFKRDKYVNDLMLRVFICGKKIDGNYKKDYSWSFPSSKVEYMDNSSKQVRVSIRHEEHEILKGSIEIEQLAENKRFITHTIPLYDSNGQKMAILKFDIRYVSKQQVLDLLYSPTKLANSRVSKAEKQKLTISKVSKKKQTLKSNSTSLMLTKKQKKLKSVLSNEIPQTDRTNNRYKKLYIMNNHHEMIIPRAKRFTEKIEVNPLVSYCDPDKQSDFSPSKHHFKYNMSLSQKVDFTKPYKNNPGPGTYKLPSIWEKY